MTIEQFLVALHNKFQDSKLIDSIAIEVQFSLTPKSEYVIDKGDEEGTFLVLAIKSDS